MYFQYTHLHCKGTIKRAEYKMKAKLFHVYSRATVPSTKSKIVKNMQKVCMNHVFFALCTAFRQIMSIFAVKFRINTAWQKTS